jgi:trimeric autotransporter adhesin
MASNNGSNNTAIGIASLYANTSGGSNTAVGQASLQNNTTASDNSALGRVSLFTNTTGANNTALGAVALYSNTTGCCNTAVGKDSLYSNTTGCFNTSVGKGSMLDSTTGNYNTALGVQALLRNTTASENTAVGYSSLCANTEGTGNTAVGMNAGLNITTGTQNTAIGSNAKPISATATGEIVLGFDVTGVGNNHFTFGNSTGANRVYNSFTANASWTRVSDERLKNNITDANLGLDFINKVRPVTFNWKPSNEIDPSLEGYHKETNENNNVVMTGFIAQEVKQALLDSGVSENDVLKYGVWSEEPTGVQAVSREMFIMPLINAIKELKAEIDILKNK